MSLLRTLGAAFLLTAAAGTNASSFFIVTTDAVVDAVNASTRATSNISSSLKDDKIVLAARDDAASFVASSGDIRSARLEGALQHIRQVLPELQATDSQLAQAILAI
ncbi:DUF2388 domain-containing protein [Pseudomonas amygdali]|uniref:DUF2388 domain-containing protein n=1 Tax=Pseudomonas amygdali TaxID=47877 RepID=UPI0005C9ACA0|nr:DUF2388 domain-containing protein [Pseudomonas amygdali]PHN37150.1 holliday junction resolvasome, helicase subunit [Pseudomonas amygdali]